MCPVCVSLADVDGRAWAALDDASGRQVSARGLGGWPGRLARHRHWPGLWRGELTLGYTGDGKRQRRKVSGKTKAAVVDKLRDLHTQLDTGITPKAG
jgi:hypothetical protein